jgi:hypothetical protein
MTISATPAEPDVVAEVSAYNPTAPAYAPVGSTQGTPRQSG